MNIRHAALAPMPFGQQMVAVIMAMQLLVLRASGETSSPSAAISGHPGASKIATIKSPVRIIARSA